MCARNVAVELLQKHDVPAHAVCDTTRAARTVPVSHS
eukprot:SAG31_NODE_162_length_21892_cov_343.171936_17_plen_37_part_00